MNRYSRPVDFERLNSINGVLNELYATQAALTGTHLSQLAFFNEAYVVMTENLVHALDRGVFTNKPQIEQLITTFALYYFDALSTYINNGDHAPVVWQLAMEGSHKRPSYISLLRGANAHINYDLSLALHKVIQKPEQFYADFLAINSVLEQTTYDVIQRFQPQNVFERLIVKTHFLYARPLVWMLKNWRHRAWQKYLKLHNQILVQELKSTT